MVRTVGCASSARLTENLAYIPWVAELGFWTELRPSQVPTLRVINDFLLRRRGQFLVAPIKERSLEVFGDAKRLDEMCTGDSLFGGRPHLRTLGCFRVPQPLPYRASGASGLPVLVIENHNTYWSFGGRGDLLLVQTGALAKPGCVVVARHGEASVARRLLMDADRTWWLAPVVQAGPRTRCDCLEEIVGPVVGLYRASRP
jgi:hypothetical protein